MRFATAISYLRFWPAIRDCDSLLRLVVTILCTICGCDFGFVIGECALYLRSEDAIRECVLRAALNEGGHGVHDEAASNLLADTR